MLQVAHALVRRTFEVAGDAARAKEGGLEDAAAYNREQAEIGGWQIGGVRDDGNFYELGDPWKGDVRPMWAVAMLFLTFIVFILTMSAIEYTYGEVVARLAMIETPTTTLVERHESKDIKSEDEKSVEPLLEPELLLIKQAPLTAKFRTIIMHLRSIGGPLARFRGLHWSILYAVIVGINSRNIAALPYFYQKAWARPVFTVLFATAFCSIRMLWTRAIISMPAKARWAKPVVTKQACRALFLPNFVRAVAVQFCAYVPGTLFALALDSFNNPEPSATPMDRYIALAEIFGSVLVFLGTVVIIVIPATVTLTRMEASLQPKEIDTIVPFDRTFGGRINMQEEDEPEAISMLEAWRTFDKEARARVLKVYAKNIGMQIANVLFFVMVFILELRLIAAANMGEAVHMGHDVVRAGLRRI